MLVNDIMTDHVPYETLFEELPIIPELYIILMSVFILKITKYFYFGVFWADPKISSLIHRMRIEICMRIFVTFVIAENMFCDQLFVRLVHGLK